MNISYTAPLSRAIGRMKSLLFRRPFEIETWVVIAFSAWLANIFSGTSSGAGSRWKESSRELAGRADHLGDWLANPTILMLIALGLCAFALILLVLAWVSARAEFVFLDNVVNGRPAFMAPWKRFGRLGMSLFLWNAAFSFAWLVPLAAVAWPLAPNVVSALAGNGFGAPDVAGLLLGGFVAMLCMLVIAFVATLMQDFVVPLMYRYDESAMQAWARFRPLLSREASDFGAYVAFNWVVWVAVYLCLIVAGFVTCCIGLVLMAIPYVGALVQLPVYVSGRAFGPEFLRQYGPEWDVFPPAPPAPPATEEWAEAPAIQ